MGKLIHEIRDPIHSFIRMDVDERKIIDSRPFQRLRHIHQLAMTYLVYPGATHKRFEHSLGVMELASQIYDSITQSHKIDSKVVEFLPELNSEDKKRYWRKVLRAAAICHDLGHLPFSHAAEELLRGKWDHELLTVEIIRAEEMQQIFASMTPPIRTEDVVKLAVGPKKLPDIIFSNWELILAEIIIGDVFGADRMDYLLRDSHHTGVAYGLFDHHRLIDTLRILPFEIEDLAAPVLGIEEGGIQDFPVLTQGSKIRPSSLLSIIIPSLPLVVVEYVFVAQEILCEAKKWLEKNKEAIICLKGEEICE